MITLIFLGDVVGEPGRLALYRAIPELQQEFSPQAIIVNGENAAHGRGLTPALAKEMLQHGVDVITQGDHVWDSQDMVDKIDTMPRVLRPLNFQANTPGAGSAVLETVQGKIGIICLIGRTFMRLQADNPFLTVQEELDRLRENGCNTILIDIHGEATSEKIAMALHTDGKATAVVGTHTHVQTADARILPGGTAAITDVGMCGSRDGVIGRDAADVLHANLTALPCKLNIGGWPARVSGVVITADETTGRALSIHPINRDYDR